MVERSTLQLYRTTIFPAQLWMAAFSHSINKCDQKIRLVKNKIIKHQTRRKIKATRLVKFLYCFFKLKQLGLWSFCIVSSNGWSVLYLMSFQFRTQYSFTLRFSAAQLKWMLFKMLSAFFLIICRSLGIQLTFF